MSDTLLPALVLLQDWYVRGRRDDLAVAADAFEASRLSNTRYGSTIVQPLQRAFLSPADGRFRKQRSRIVAPVLWSLVHDAHVWLPSDDELRHLLRLALLVRRSGDLPSSQILGGPRHRIFLMGLFWLAGARKEPDDLFPRVDTLERFVAGGSRDDFQRELLDDMEKNAWRAARAAQARG